MVLCGYANTYDSIKPNEALLMQVSLVIPCYSTVAGKSGQPAQGHPARMYLDRQ